MNSTDRFVVRQTTFDVEYSCQQYDDIDCFGTTLENPTATNAMFSSDSQWTVVRESLGLTNKPNAFS